MKTILVTGATGTVGSKVVKELARHDVIVRAAVRKVTTEARAAVVPVEFDYEKNDTMSSALRGVDTAFLLAPSIRDQVGASARFIELAKAVGVKRIVKLSALGCDEEPTISFGRAHRDVERLLGSSGMEWTALRPNNFMDNFLGDRHGTFAPNQSGEIALPWGSAACSFIAADDIARVAAVVLATGGHHDERYDLTGPAAVSLAQAAEVIASVARRPIRYVDTPEADVRQRMLALHMPPPMVEAVLELHALGRAGRAAVVTKTVEEITGHPARSFSEFAKEHAQAWAS